MISIYIPSALRQAILTRAQECCEYCHSPAEWSPEIFEIEHIIPLSLKGKTVLANFAYACPACNRYKRNHLFASDPLTNTVASIFHPRQMPWEDHFRWRKDFSWVEGLTPIGRATVVLLKMNRPSVCRFRQALVALGVHPALP
jgi:HNH endonuclease